MKMPWQLQIKARDRPRDYLGSRYAFLFGGTAAGKPVNEQTAMQMTAVSSCVRIDRWGAVQMTQNLEALGFTVVPFGQGFKDMSPPTKELMKLTLEQKVAHTAYLSYGTITYLVKVYTRTRGAAVVCRCDIISGLGLHAHARGGLRAKQRGKQR